MRKMVEKKQWPGQSVNVLFLSFAAFVCAAIIPCLAAPPDTAKPLAKLASVTGTVLMKEADSPTWKEVREGTEIPAGAGVKTRERSTALVEFDNGSYIKMLPLSKLYATIHAAEDGTVSSMVNMDGGRVWAKMDFAGEKEQFVIKVNDAVLRGRSAAAFIEGGAADMSCLDLKEGTVTVASSTRTEERYLVSAHQRVVVSGIELAAPVGVDEIPDLGEEKYSCLPAPGKTEETEAPSEQVAVSADGGAAGHASAAPGDGALPESAGGDEYISISLSAQATFGAAQESAGEASSEPAAVKTPEPGEETGEEAPEMMAIDVESEREEPEYYSPGGEEEKEIEYEEMTVTGEASATFGGGEEKEDAAAKTTGGAPEEETAAGKIAEGRTPVTGASACDTYPEFSDVTVTDEDAEDTGEVAMESDLPCDLHATASVRWNARLDCGGIKRMSFTRGARAPVFFNGGGPGETVNGFFEFAVTDNKPVQVLIKAEGDNGKETLYTFTIKLMGQSLSARPQISDVLVNGMTADQDSMIHIDSRDCGTTMKVAISGNAYSECGDIENVIVVVDGTEAAVKGKDTWSVERGFDDDSSFSVEIKAKDTSGRESEDYTFDVDLVRAIDIPTVEIETIGGEPVVQFGDAMEIYRNSLESGNLYVRGTAGSSYCSLTKIEVSTDGDTSWFPADGSTSWSYGFRPSDGTYEILTRAYDNAGQESEEMASPIEIIYSKYTLEEKLLITFEEMMQAYRDKDSAHFMETVDSAFSSGYDSIEDYNRLESALDGKFSEQTSIYIRYQKTSSSVSGKTTGRVSFNWDADSRTAGYSHSATFVFTRQTGSGWKLLNVEDKNTFLRHTDIAAYITAISSRDFLEADSEDSADITVEVRDSAYNPVKDGTMVSFQATSGEIEATSTTVEGIAEEEYTAGLTEGTVTVTARSGSVSAALSIFLIPDKPLAPPDHD